MSKEMWIEEFERLVAQYEDEGLDEDAARAKAERGIDAAYSDRLADIADYARMRAKEG